MSDKHFIGLDLTGLEDNGIQRPVSRVTLLLDDENAVTAGDDTGLEIVADCPHASRAMASAILSRVKGYQYRMFSADDAALDPAAELGDGVTAGGLYSVLSRLSDDGSGYSGIAAPGEAELEDEFPTTGPMTQEFNRKLGTIRSSIKKTAEEITLLVEDTARGLSASFSVQLDRISSTVTGLDGKVSEVEQTAESITQRVESAEGSIKTTLDLVNGFTVTDSSGSTKIKGSVIATDTLNLTGAIKFTDLNTSTQSTINAASSNASNALSNANSAFSMASSAQNTVNGWVYPGTTMINGNSIMTGTVQASILRGGRVELLEAGGLLAGAITILKSGVGSNGIVRIQSDEMSLITSNPNGILALGAMGSSYNPTMLRLWPDGRIETQGSLYPATDRRYELGLPGLGWMDLYVGNVPIITSDQRKKEAVTYGLDRYDALFDALRPVSFRLIDGQSGRTHLGLISQDVEAALEASGLTDMDFAGFIRSPKISEDGSEIPGEYDYALRYGEFIAMGIDQTQKLKARVEQLERRLAQ